MSKIHHLFKLISRRPQQIPETKRDGFFQVRSASELLEPHRELVDKIRQYFGVPETVWISTHNQLLQNFAYRVQLLPASDAHHHPEPGGLLRQSLETVNHAMRIRRGYMLPNGASTERISEQQEIWSFAVFCAALLHGIGKSITDVTITNHKGSESHWSLTSGDLPPDAWYRPNLRGEQRNDHYPAIPLLVTGQIIPPTALQWLSQYPDVFILWLSTLSGRHTEAGVLGEIISKATQYAPTRQQSLDQPLPLDSDVIVTPNEKHHHDNQDQGEANAPSPTSETESPQIDLKSMVLPPGMEQFQADLIDLERTDATQQRLHPEAKKEPQQLVQPATEEPVKHEETGKTTSRRAIEKQAGQQFVQWLREHIIEGKIGLNTVKAQLHTVDEGLLLVSPAIFKRYLQNTGHIELSQLQRGFQSLGIHRMTPSKKSVWTYQVHSGNRKSKLHGMLITDPLTVLDLNYLPETNPLLTAETNSAGKKEKTTIQE